jgi:hypothetical protein
MRGRKKEKYSNLTVDMYLRESYFITNVKEIFFLIKLSDEIQVFYNYIHLRSFNVNFKQILM